MAQIPQVLEGDARPFLPIRPIPENMDYLDMKKTDRLYKLLQPFPKKKFIPLDEMKKISRNAKLYSTIQEHRCNGTETKRHVQLEAGIELYFEAVVRDYFESGVRVEFQGDPRGHTVKLYADKDSMSIGLDLE